MPHIFSDVWQYGITSSASFVLDVYNPSIQGWVGTIAGACNLDASDAATFFGCTETFNYTYDRPLPTANTFTLVLQGTNRYLFYPSDYQVQNVDQTVDNSCAPDTVGGQGPLNWTPVMNQVHDLSATGFSLTGSETVKMDSPRQPMSVALEAIPRQSMSPSPGISSLAR